MITNLLPAIGAFEPIFDLVEFLALTGVKSILILLFAFFVSLAFRGASASQRHLLWVVAFVAVLVLPIISLVTPAWETAWPGISATGLVAAEKTIDIKTPPARQQADSNPAIAKPALLQQNSPRQESDGIMIHAILAIWLAGMFFVLSRLAYGHYLMKRFRLKSTAVAEPPWSHVAERISRDLGIGKPIGMRFTNETHSPLAWGFVKPIVFLPKEAAQWQPEKRRIVLIHEFAHVKRRDLLMLNLANLVCAVYWWNPLIWVAKRQMQRQAEYACDDYVLRAGTKASDYAEQLLRVIGKLTPQNNIAMATSAMARRSEFEGRVLAILDKQTTRSLPTVKNMMTTGLLVACSMIPLAALSPVTPTNPQPSVGIEGLSKATDHGFRDADLSWKKDGVRTTIEMKDVRISANYRGVEEIKSSGFLRINRNENGVYRQVEVIAGPEGELEHIYRVDGRQREFGGLAEEMLIDGLQVVEKLDDASVAVEAARETIEHQKQQIKAQKKQLAKTIKKQQYELQQKIQLEKQQLQKIIAEKKRQAKTVKAEFETQQEINEIFAVQNRRIAEISSQIAAISAELASKQQQDFAEHQEELARQQSQLDYQTQRAFEESKRDFAEARVELERAQEEIDRHLSRLKKELKRHLSDSLDKIDGDLGHDAWANSTRQWSDMLDVIIESGQLRLQESSGQFQSSARQIADLLNEVTLRRIADLDLQMSEDNLHELEAALNKIAIAFSDYRLAVDDE